MFASAIVIAASAMTTFFAFAIRFLGGVGTLEAKKANRLVCKAAGAAVAASSVRCFFSGGLLAAVSLLLLISWKECSSRIERGNNYTGR